METLSLNNAFGAPVFYRESLSSTMDEARAIVESGAKHGTVIAAGFQTAGRGRSGRAWRMKAGESLPFTVILRYAETAAIPPCLTLRAGLALARAVEGFAGLSGRVFVKWPNDLMLLWKDGRARKTAGILTEASGGTVFLGMGINLTQCEFPPELEGKAGSIAGALASWEFEDRAAERRFPLLEAILAELYAEFETLPRRAAASFRTELEARLYLRGRTVRFVPGPAPVPENAGAAAGAGPDEIEGILEGIGEGGELLLRLADGRLSSFTTGELRVY